MSLYVPLEMNTNLRLSSAISLFHFLSQPYFKLHFAMQNRTFHGVYTDC
jgi:hypothetical protein